jgi:HSP20 family protein
MLPATPANGSVLTATPSNRLSELVGRLFDADPFPGPLAPRPAWPALPMSVWEDEQALNVEIDAPGVAEPDIDLSLHDGELIVRCERKRQRPGTGYDTRAYGRFEQRLVLPCAVDADKVGATLTNGVLAVTLPKSEAAKPRKIAIKSE